MASVSSTASHQSTDGDNRAWWESNYVWVVVGHAAIAGGLALAIAAVLCNRRRPQLQLRLRPPTRWLPPFAGGAATATTTRRIGGTTPLEWPAAAARSQKVMIEMTRALEMLPVHVCPDPELATPTSDGASSSSGDGGSEANGEAGREGGGEAGSGSSNRSSSGTGCCSPSGGCVGLDGLWLGECAICLSDFSPGERLRPLPCKHVFHASCIDRWLIGRCATELTPPTCPLCKAVAVRCPSFDTNGAEDAPPQMTPPQVEMDVSQLGSTAV